MEKVKESDNSKEQEEELRDGMKENNRRTKMDEAEGKER